METEQSEVLEAELIAILRSLPDSAQDMLLAAARGLLASSGRRREVDPGVGAPSSDDPVLH